MADDLVKSASAPHHHSSNLIPVKEWVEDHSKAGGGYYATKYESPDKGHEEHQKHDKPVVDEKTAKKMTARFYNHCHDDKDFMESVDKLGIDYSAQAKKDIKELQDAMPNMKLSKDDEYNLTVAAARTTLIHAIKHGLDPFKQFPEKKNEHTPYHSSSAPDFFKDTEDDWDISLRDACAVRLYTDSIWTYLLNSYLRGMDPPPKFQFWNNGKYYKDDVEGITKLTKHLESAIDKFELTEPITVRRELQRELNGKDLLQQFMKAPNGIFQEKSFASTSPVSGSFNADPGEKSIVLRVKLPKGKGIGAWVRSLSGFPDENEFLLQRGCEFKITTDLSKIDANAHQVVIDCELYGIAPTPLEEIEKQHKQQGTLVESYNELGRRKDIDHDLTNAEWFFTHN